jgi:hypothetical protein
MCRFITNIGETMLKQIMKDLIKEELFEKQSAPSGSIDQRFIGKMVMVRTYSAGVHFGILEEKAGMQVILKDSRRVFYWTSACSLSQLAIEGSKDIASCRIAMTVPQLLLDQAIEVIPMSQDSINILAGAEVWKK